MGESKADSRNNFYLGKNQLKSSFKRSFLNFLNFFFFFLRQSEPVAAGQSHLSLGGHFSSFDAF